MKILLIGLGSIGMRHLKHLQNMPGLELASLRSKKGELKKESGIFEFYDLSQALEFKPSGVIISNPTSMHVQTALPFLKENIKVLIEKPISVSIKNAELLRPFKSLIRVAYCMRFSSVNHFLKEKFTKDEPFKIGFKRSFYLPNWHPYADYRKEYTALKSLGGGVIRTLSHEIDISLHWFGEPTKVEGVVDQISFLEIDTDDYAFFSTKNNRTRVNFELDFFSPNNVNIGEAYTEEGKYEWEAQNIYFTSYNTGLKEKIFTAPQDFVRQMYQDQMEDFCEFLTSGKSLNASFDDGMKVLEIIEKVERHGEI